MNIGEDVEKLEHSCTIGENAKWCSFWKNVTAWHIVGY
jgi:hypothetical protein